MKTENAPRPPGRPAWRMFRRTFLLLALLLSTLLAAGAAAVDVNTQELAIFNYMRNSGGQHRPTMTLDPILCRVARARAQDMANRHYFAHVNPNGQAANYLVRQAGYVLPPEYSTAPSANELESISAGRDTASWTWSDWMGSPMHKRHLLAEHSFYAAQTSVGVGYVNVPGSEWQWYWVVITAPPSGPQLVITAPAANAKVFDPAVTVSGTTGGNPAATAVQVRAEANGVEGAWVTATGTASWTAKVEGLQAGPNTVRIQTLGGDGSVLRETVRTVKYSVLAPVTLAVNGNGTIAPVAVGTSNREVGVAFNLTATAKAGYIFSGWTGSVTSPSRIIAFTPALTDNTLTANFIPNPFLAGVGAYSGLFTSNAGNPGRVTVALTGAGLFTGSISLDGKAVAIKGRFDATGAATVTTTIPGGAAYTLTLNYSNTTGTPTISGSLGTNGWSTDLGLDSFAKPGTITSAGRYTLVLPTPTNATDIPTGDGAATVVVAASGAAKVSGSLADGRTFTAASRVTTNNTLQVFIAPYLGKGRLAGTLNFRALTTSDIDGHLFWARPVSTAKTKFASGFVVDINAVGSRYTAPKAGESILPVTSGPNNTALSLGDGGLVDPVVQEATLSPANALVITNRTVAGLTAAINPLSGTFSGQFVHPTTKAVTTFRGVILQKQGAGFGYFAGGNEAGYATFTPANTAATLIAP